MLSTAVVVVLSCIQSHNKKWLTDIMIYSLENVLLEPQSWLEGLSGFVRVCLSFSLTFCLSFCPSFLHPSVSPFCLFRSVSFVGIYTLVFCDIWHKSRAPCGIVCGIFTEKSDLRENDQKWSKMTQNGIFQNLVINFCLKH